MDMSLNPLTICQSIAAERLLGRIRGCRQYVIVESALHENGMTAPKYTFSQ